MPTGFTAEILDGKIAPTDFRAFATLLSRAFGATIHMRDESLDAEYVPRKVSQYYLDSLEKSKIALAELETISDEDLLIQHTARLNESLEYHAGKIVEANADADKMRAMIAELEKWVVPTPQHVEFKKYALDQLTSTLERDGDPSYHVREQAKLQAELLQDAATVRAERLEELTHSLEYDERQIREETKRCEEANTWMTKLFDSLPAKP